MSTECKEAIEGDQARSSEDYRLNFKLAEACKKDTGSLCPNMCEAHQACGGQVLRCLTEKCDQIQAKTCRDEVFYFKKMEVTDFRNDVLLAEACRDDVDEYCNKVKPGRIHASTDSQQPVLRNVLGFWCTYCLLVTYCLFLHIHYVCLCC